MNFAGAALLQRGQIRENRIKPNLAPAQYKTYGVTSPLTSHWRRATCEEFGCQAFLNGWESIVDISSDLGRAQCEYLLKDKERSPRVEKVGETSYKFIYGPGFRCFKSDEHRVKNGRPALLLVKGGDWRGNPNRVPTVVHKTWEDWADDFATHQDKLARAQN